VAEGCLNYTVPGTSTIKRPRVGLLMVDFCVARQNIQKDLFCNGPKTDDLGRISHAKLKSQMRFRFLGGTSTMTQGMARRMRPTSHHAGTMKEPQHTRIILEAINLVKRFYVEHTEIKASHGWIHIEAVLHHTTNALTSLESTLSSETTMEIQLAALLHDMDDKKYFPATTGFPNASGVLERAGIHHDKTGESDTSHQRILDMISWVGCSENGNSVPDKVQQTNAYHFLIPRWADRLEAVGDRGVVRCYQYNREQKAPLSSSQSPRPTSEDELWSTYVTPNKLQDYMDRGGRSTDMISHYYDKLLHIARPPKEIVRNAYLERQAASGSKSLVEVCLSYGKTGKVDEAHIQSLMSEEQAIAKRRNEV
jgi:uncharacterized protein